MNQAPIQTDTPRPSPPLDTMRSIGRVMAAGTKRTRSERLEVCTTQRDVPLHNVIGASLGRGEPVVRLVGAEGGTPRPAPRRARRRSCVSPSGPRTDSNPATRPQRPLQEVGNAREQFDILEEPDDAHEPETIVTRSLHRCPSCRKNKPKVGSRWRCGRRSTSRKRQWSESLTGTEPWRSASRTSSATVRSNRLLSQRGNTARGEAFEGVAGSYGGYLELLGDESCVEDRVVDECGTDPAVDRVAFDVADPPVSRPGEVGEGGCK